MFMNRRGILLGLASVLAAPAIVHAGNLMPVKALRISEHTAFAGARFRLLYKDHHNEWVEYHANFGPQRFFGIEDLQPIVGRIDITFPTGDTAVGDRDHNPTSTT